MENLGQQVEETIKSNSVVTRTESPQKELLALPEASKSAKISPIREYPNLKDIVDVEKINALFGNTSYPVVSQLESTLSPLEPTRRNTFP